MGQSRCAGNRLSALLTMIVHLACLPIPLYPTAPTLLPPQACKRGCQVGCSAGWLLGKLGVTSWSSVETVEERGEARG